MSDPFGDRIDVVQDDPGPHDPNHPGHISADPHPDLPEQREGLRELPCPSCDGQPMSPDCGLCGGSGTLPDATPVLRAALRAPATPSAPEAPSRGVDVPCSVCDGKGWLPATLHAERLNALATPSATGDGGLDAERLARAFYAVTQKRLPLPDWRNPSIDAAVWDKAVVDGAEVAAEYVRLSKATPEPTEEGTP